MQTGNGSTLTFTVPAFTSSPTLNFKTWGSNACFTDSLITSFIQPVLPVAVPIVYSDTLICSGHENFEVSVQNSQAGIWYKMVDGFLGVVDSAAGNNGTLTLTAPLLYGFNQTRNIYIRGYLNNSCQPILKNIQLHVDSLITESYVITPSVNPGQNITFSNTSYADSYLWTFPPQASIPSSTLQNPVITINTPGYYPVTFITSNNEGCSDSLLLHIAVNGVAPTTNTDFCGNGTTLPTHLSTFDSHLDTDKNLYVTGTYFSNSPSMNYRYFVYKMDSTGELKWFRTVGNFTYEKSFGHGITTDTHGNVYVAGQFDGVRVFFGSIDFNAGNYSKSKGFLVKLDPDGNEKWLLKMQRADTSGVGCWMSDVVADNNDNIYVTGGHNNAVFHFPDSTSYTASGYSGSGFLLKVDTLGTFTGYSTFGATSGGLLDYEQISFAGLFHNPRINRLTGNRIAVGAAFKNSTPGVNMSVSFGSYNFTDTSTVCYGAILNTGTQSWTNAVRGPAGKIDHFTDFETDASNNYYFAGLATRYLKTNSWIELDSDHDMPNPIYYTHSFITRVNSAGTHAWINQTRFNQVTDIEITPAGKLLCSVILPSNGNMQNSNNVPMTFDTLGKYDYGIGVYDLSGNLESLSPKGTANHDVAYAVKADACNNIVVVAAVNRSGQPSYPHPQLAGIGGTVSVDRYTQDGFCTHTASCIGVVTNTLSHDASLLDVWMNTDLAGQGSFPVSVRLKNFATTALTSAQVIVSVNGTNQITYSWNGTLNQYQMADSIAAGTVNLITTGINQVKAWVQLPNGSADLNHANDTVYLSIEVCAPLAGTYTIGAGGSFPTFSEASKRLKNCGLNGHVYFDVLPGVYNDRLILKNIPSGVNDSIVFRSANGDSTSVVLQSGFAFPLETAIAVFNNTDYVTLERMTIKNPDLESVIGNVIKTDGGCSHFNLKNCVIIHENPDTINGSGYLLWMSDTGAHSASITNNLFFQGEDGILLSGAGNQGVVVANNKFINQTGGVIRIQNQVNPVITNNLIESDFHEQNVYWGILLGPMTQGFNCSNNIIRATGGNAYGIGFNTLNGASTPGIISNNMIAVTQSKENTYGIHLGESSNVKVYNNSVLIGGNSKSSIGIYKLSGSMTNVEFKNNLITMRDSGYAIQMDIFQAGLITDNNCYHVEKDTLARIGTSMFQNPYVYYQSLADWQAFSGHDATSFNHDPAYLSSTDLHIPVDVVLDDAALPFPEVPFDVDGQPRSATTPDMGADEFDCGTLAALNVPASPLCSTDTLHLSVSTSPTAQVQWYINGNQFATTDSIAIANPAPGQMIIETQVTSGTCSSVLHDTLSIVAGTLVSITAAGPTTFCQGDSVQLNATAGLSTYQWLNHYNPILNATAGSFYAKVSGRYRVVGTNANGCMESSSPIIVSVPCIQIGPPNPKIASSNDGWSLHLYPNPAADKIFLEINCPYSGITKLILRDVAGKVVLTEKLVNGTNTIALDNISPGLYFTECHCGNESRKEKIVIIED